ncbi:(E)-4-hydroxy-3-methylbut-2-enyl-diphosphate synthase [Bacteroidales bacterium OttesenSCG-928-B11]|nr:(E)-4-hydroxy-3-methylbut-2-enyl-diphosphate synthase [Bacteroidales bacterium OttesenSCG-928-C03]MDL2312722.1 (E)-4-hydroxy-3-methylbut-2-enyl-diphosphate synthase [Bacteroidales bacterium OttesenSCG-928-B11]MDL2326422.1 (E)-4-hydroxy-3-methylbut-2-enyl-diphosphate synthase [Bacteroidales bacterium OttesenSCG-928-A14]
MKVKKVNIRHISIGENLPVIPQSMTNTNTRSVQETINQSLRIVENGGKMVRISVPSREDVKAMQTIVDEIRKLGYDFPIIADVHFNPEIAEMLSGIVDKIRINPGNFTDKKNNNQHDFSAKEHDDAFRHMKARARPLIEKCKERGTAIRVGVNQGSLSDRIIARYGHTPLALAKSAIEWIDICEEIDFENVLFSLKSSNVYTMVEAYKIFHKEMEMRGSIYPLHVGVTEAGYGLAGRVKSAVGIGALLLEGVGSTIRVSLTEKPEDEIPFANHLIQFAASDFQHHYFIENEILHYIYDEEDYDRWIAGACAVSGYEHFRHKLKGIIVKNRHFSSEQQQELTAAIEQACRIKISKTEIISCPTCSRTDYDIEKVIKIAEERFSHFPGLKIGVMGCVVNGPGEMADADFGIVGASGNKVVVYQGKNRITPVLPLEEGIAVLEKAILKFRN